MSVFTAYWSERAQRSEQDADRMAVLLETILCRAHLGDAEWRATQDCLRDYRSNRERRYRALPTGHTLTGNLTSGGIL